MTAVAFQEEGGKFELCEQKELGLVGIASRCLAFRRADFSGARGGRP